MSSEGELDVDAAVMGPSPPVEIEAQFLRL
jgi:hypothetical protein